ncbi:MAG: type II secretion system F family protein [Actinomycetota bacterium]
MSPEILMAALFAGGGLGLTLVAQGMRRARRVSNLKALLDSAYLEEIGKQAGAERQADVRRLVAQTTQAAERALAGTELLKNLRRKIERSDWKLSPGEFVSLTLGLAGSGLLVGLLVGSAPLAVLLAGFAVAGPYLLVSRSVENRKRRFEGQLPDVLELIASSLEAGGGVPRALELVVSEAQEPASTEFARVLSATRLGTPLVDALKEMRDRLGSRDLAWTVQAIIVQQRTGGRLADVLRVVAEFMRSREEIRRDLRALTAEGRLSGYVLGALPFFLATALLFMNPGYLNPLFTTPLGLVMTGVTAVLMSISFILMKKIVKVEV